MRPLRCCLFIYIVAIVTTNAGLATTDSLSLQSSVSEPNPQIAINKDIENYLATIEQLEFQGGIYSDNLSQNLIQLGTLYQHNDKHANAVEVFERALFLHRINDGLYSNNQVAVIEKIINSLTRLKKWNLVNDRFSHLYWLANKSLQHDQEKRLEITLRCAHWQLEAYNLRVAKIPMQSLVLGYKLFETALRISSEEYGGADLRLIEPLNGLLVSTYLAATNKPSRDPRSIPLRGYRNGINLITLEIDILQRQERLDHLRLTNAKLKLADWQLMYGKDRVAMMNYGDAYRYAETNDKDSQLVNRLFSQPIALPYFPSFFTPNISGELSEQIISDKVKYVHASFNVTPKGNVRNIKVLGLNPPEQNGRHNMVLRNLRHLKFRPRISDGVTILTEQTQLHILIK